jgi:glyoxylase-like metal-dependent hydrolase (beta-lactamase superfamily II)
MVGNGALDLLSGKTQLNLGKHMVFEPDLLPSGDRTIELPPVDDKSFWQPFSTFPHASDLFKDGSVYIADAPGHLPGHLNLICRISKDPVKFVCLAGDSCHDRRLLTGECDIATWTDETGRYCCMHVDIPKSKETLARLYSAYNDGLKTEGQGKPAEFEVIFAHDYAWEERAKEQEMFWPGKVS